MALQIIQTFPGAKNKHRTSLCRCDCGGQRIVRSDRLQRGEINSCAKCSRISGAKKGGDARRYPDDVWVIKNVLWAYRNNAKKKGRDFSLSEDEFTALIVSDCIYCGSKAAPTNGVDRVCNSIGYTPTNSVSACSTCNMAKRDMSAESFISWIRRAHEHQCLLQRD